MYRVYGGQPVDMGNAGALPNSNFLAGGNFIGGEGSAIDPEAFKRDQRQQKIYNKGIKTDNPNEKEIFLRRTGPQLPLAGIGNAGGLIAQAVPGGASSFGMAENTFSPGTPENNGSIPIGNAPFAYPFQGQMQLPTSTEDVKTLQEKQRQQQIFSQRMQERSSNINQPINYRGPIPVNFNADLVEGGVEKLGGNAVIQLDPNQRLTVGGSYMPGYSEQGVQLPSEYRVEAGYQTPGVSFNVNYRPRRQGAPINQGGFGGEARFNMPF
jgi:hypothetical protein